LNPHTTSFMPISTHTS